MNSRRSNPCSSLILLHFITILNSFFQIYSSICLLKILKFWVQPHNVLIHICPARMFYKKFHEITIVEGLIKT